MFYSHEITILTSEKLGLTSDEYYNLLSENGADCRYIKGKKYIFSLLRLSFTLPSPSLLEKGNKILLATGAKPPSTPFCSTFFKSGFLKATHSLKPPPPPHSSAHFP